MSLHRRNPRRDRNEKAIVGTLEQCGCVVYRISATGVPDLLCGYRGAWFLVEVKYGRGSLEPQQAIFHSTARALNLPCFEVRTIEAAAALVKLRGAVRP